MELLQRLWESNNKEEQPSGNLYQPETTYSGTTIPPVKTGLPKEINSICPDCTRIIKATLYPEGGKVWIKKSCAEHGEFKDIFYGDIDLYYRTEGLWFGDGRGIEDPAVKNATVCPSQCGLCNMHTSHSGLPIMDLTNRCNLTCPVCFANANASGYLYEPSFDEVKKMLETIANQKPVKANMVQFSGGEPTVRPDFIKIVETARDMGFYYIQLNTNGIKTADYDFARACKNAGVDNLYLQFDGVSDDIYKKTRSKALFEYKMKTIENCRKLKMDVILVVTLVKTYNDHQVGDIVRFAIENSDVVSGIAFQPVSFVGRFSQKHRLEKRYTLADLALDLEKQTGQIEAMRDWFPISAIQSFSRLAAALTGKAVYTPTLHPHCSQGTYIYIDKTGKMKPVSSFLEMDEFMKDMVKLSKEIQPSRFNLLSKVKIFNRLKKHYHRDRAPDGMGFEKFLKSLDGYQSKDSRRVNAEKKEYKGDGDLFRNIFIAGMHFMDAYNFSEERVRRCVVHYTDPSGKLYPFCAYNGATSYRKRVESRYKHSPEEFKEKYLKEGRPKELEMIAKKMDI